jgi:hypothetical protein
MSFIAKDLELNQKLKGKVVASAASNRSMFALKFEDGTGLLVEVMGTREGPLVETRLMPAEELPRIGDDFSKIEWSWMASSRLESVRTVIGALDLNLDPSGKLSILGEVSDQGSLFLSFIPPGVS